MKAISKLKDDARRHELKEEWEKAIQAYLHALRAGEEGEGELELPLYNRVGDLYLRLGRPNDAVTYYEQAADRYAESGLYNNAIALCNKALRYRPDNLGLLRKLGEYSASQGFFIDARRYFLEYAEKQFVAGAADEAITALKDFADVADDPEILELLGLRLAARGRTAEALEELQKAHRLFLKEGLDDRAASVLAEMRGIDPDVTLVGAGDIPGSRAPDAGAADVTDELPQLADLDFAADPPVVADATADAPADPSLHDLDITPSFEPGGEPAAEPMGGGTDEVTAGPVMPDGLEITGIDSDDIEPGDVDVIEGLESTALDFGDIDLDVEATDFGLDLQRDETSFGSPDMGTADDTGTGAPEAEGALELPSIWNEDEPPSFADNDDPDIDGPAFDLPTLDDVDAGIAPPFDLPVLDDASDAPSFELPVYDDASRADDPDPARLANDADVAPDADEDFIPLPMLGDDADTGLTEPLDLLAPQDVDDSAEMGHELPAPAGDEAGTESTEPPVIELPAVEGEPGEAVEAEAEPGRTGAVAPFEDVEDVEDWPQPPEWVVDPTGQETGVDEAADAEPGPLLAWDGEWADAASPDEAGLAFEYPGADSSADVDEATGLQPVEPTAGLDVDEPVAAAGQDSQPAVGDRNAETVAGETEAAMDESPVPAEPRVDADASAGTGGWSPADVMPPEEDGPVAGGGQPPVESPRAGPPADEGFVDLGALLADEVEETTRFRVQEKSPTGDEDRDFAELLNQFKEKVSAHVPAEDSAAHYDLGLAFKEMGLLDEAITEFQIALRTGPMRLKVYEELGDCFLQKGQFNIAEKVLRRALDARPEDEHDLLGVYYYLGRAYEELGRRDEARDAFERVLGMDISFRDVAHRLSRL